MAREHDPGDAVPPGVAPRTPAPLTPADREALHQLERFGSRQAATTPEDEADINADAKPDPKAGRPGGDTA